MRLKLVAGLACVLSLIAVAASANTTLGWYVAADVGVHDMDNQKLVVHDVTLVSHEETDDESSSSSSSSVNGKLASGTNQIVAIDDIEDIDDGVYGLDTPSHAAAFLRAGNQLTPHWRAELEYGERPSDIKHGLYQSGSEYDSENTAGRGSLDLSSLMLNVLYDISPDSKAHPFIGVGAGAVRVKADYEGNYQDSYYSAAYSIHSKKTVSAYQLIAGLAWSVSERLNIDLTYRYLETGKVNYDVRVDTSYYDYDDYNPCEDGCENTRTAKLAPAYNARTFVEDTYNVRTSSKIRDQSFTVGLRWAFGAPRAPVAAVMPAGEPVAPSTDYSAPAPVVAPVVAPPRRNFTVYFPFDSANPTADGQAVMSAAAEQANDQPGAPVVVTGHADTSGSAPYNIQLSQKRARMVADGLIQMGVPASVVSTDWKGEAQPAIPTGDGVARAENRRATISVGQ